MIAFIDQVPKVIFMVCGVCTLGILAGWPAAHWIGRKMAEFLSGLPTARFARPSPLFGIPRSMTMRGDLHGAVAKYEEMLLEYPAERELYYRLYEIVLGRLNDQSHAADILQRAMRNLPREHDREVMLELQAEIISGSYHPGCVVQSCAG